MPKKILIVDDEPKMIEAVQKCLKAGGYDFILASDGREGLKKAKEEKPDLIISDILMPEMDGVSMAAALRNEPEVKNIPVVLLSRIAAGEKGRRIGGLLVLHKPVKAKELILAVKDVLKE